MIHEDDWLDALSSLGAPTTKGLAFRDTLARVTNGFVVELAPNAPSRTKR